MDTARALSRCSNSFSRRCWRFWPANRGCRVQRTSDWATHGPDGGRVLALASSAPDGTTIYAGSSAGLFKSEDRALHWRKLNLFFRHLGRRRPLRSPRGLRANGHRLPSFFGDRAPPERGCGRDLDVDLLLPGRLLPPARGLDRSGRRLDRLCRDVAEQRDPEIHGRRSKLDVDSGRGLARRRRPDVAFDPVRQPVRPDRLPLSPAEEPRRRPDLGADGAGHPE